MKNMVQKRCELLAGNRNLLHKGFMMESSLSRVSMSSAAALRRNEQSFAILCFLSFIVDLPILYHTLGSVVNSLWLLCVNLLTINTPMIPMVICIRGGQKSHNNFFFNRIFCIFAGYLTIFCV